MSVFKTTDPKERPVILKLDTWENKILRSHTEMDGLLPQIRGLIEDPCYILYDETQGEPNTHREEYWDLMAIAKRHQVRALRAVVEFYDNEPKRPGEIVTVHIAGKVKGKTERRIIHER